MSTENAPSLPGDLRDAVVRMGLLGNREPARAWPLSGGVASEIWKVEGKQAPFCVKQALARLKVAQKWEAPVERNRYELAWFRTAAEVVPESVPEILGEDREACAFAMTWYPADQFRVWKSDLMDGRVEVGVAVAVGRVLARIHNHCASREDLKELFSTDDIFYSLRAEPYLIATERRHPELKVELERLSSRTMETKLTLVHGDISPKNILVGGPAPVILDAECAWYGDPAFDLAFCLNHLLLKCLWSPRNCERFLEAFQAFETGYLNGVEWEDPRGLEERAARLLPGLLLARVDGKSPVEYLTAEALKQVVRSVARRFLKRPVTRLGVISGTWRDAVVSLEKRDDGEINGG